MGYPRYRFDLRFDVGASEPPPVIEEEPDPLDRPVHSERELQSALAQAAGIARAEGLEAGRREGEAAATARLEADLLLVMTHLDDRLSERADGFEAALRAVEDQGVTVVAALVRRLAPHLLERIAEEEIRRLAGEALRAAVGAPRLRLRLAPAMAEALKERLAQQAAGQGFKGALEVLPDPALSPGALDARWGAGALRYDPRDIDTAIASFVERAAGDLRLEPPSSPSLR
jgi:flagellar assembly protein FliH